MAEAVGSTNHPEPSAGQAAPVAPTGRNRRVGIILLGLLAVLLIGGALWYIRYQTHGRYFQSTNDAYVQSDAVVVASKVAGYVDQIFVNDNQAVRAGEPLLRVDPREFEAQAAQSQAQIDVARASAQGVQAQISEQQAAIKQAQAQLATARSNLNFARSQVARYTPLAATGAETREHLKQLQTDEHQAANQFTYAQGALLGARRRTGSLRSQVQQAQAQGQAAKAQLRVANVNLASTLIRASIDGRVANKTVQGGQLVQPGVRLMSIVPLTQLYVSANFKETQLALMRVGQPATIKIDALSVELHGRVESFAPGTGAQFALLPPQNATGNFTKIVQRVPVRISIAAGPLAQRLLLPGMSAEVTVDTTSASGERQRLREEAEAHRAAAR